jgi:acetyl esterase/lipase
MDRSAGPELHPPIDAELAETVWSAMVEVGVGFNLTLDQIPGLRKMQEQMMPSDDFLRRGGAIDLEERSIPGPQGAPDLTAVILRPAGRTDSMPCIYYTANGGKIVRHPRLALTDHELDWVEDLPCVLVSVAGRVGPEDRHPALVEDAYAGLVWVSANADGLRIDPNRLIILGKSGGGGLAAATALYARDHGGPRIAHQILIYPMLDDRELTYSSKFEGVPWDRTSNQTGWRAILGDDAGGSDVSPYAAAARATDLHGLPPAYLETGSSEIFRDEIITYASRLAEADVPTELHSWAGGFHGFELAAPDADISRAALAARTSYLRRALRPGRLAQAAI